MSEQPDFTIMTSTQLRTYILEHRTDQDALQAYLDKRRAENPNPRTYRAQDDTGAAIAEYLKHQQEKDAS